MEKLSNYIRLLRPKHYLKNGLILLPLMFAGQLLDGALVIKALIAFVAFSLVASFVYIVNDTRDRKLDALHPKKKNRPIASGKVGVGEAIILAAVVLTGAILLQLSAGFNLVSTLLLAVYIAINLAYSIGLKNVPIADIAILSLGFILRVYYGGEALGVEISNWLYLAVLAFSLYLGLGKRRNEILAHGSTTRKVNKFYTKDFLDKNMYVCLGLTIVYYSLWTIDPAQRHPLMFLTVPLVIIIAMTYSLDVEKETSDGDPVEVLFANKPLLALVAVYGIAAATILYL